MELVLSIGIILQQKVWKNNLPRLEINVKYKQNYCKVHNNNIKQFFRHITPFSQNVNAGRSVIALWK